KLCPHGIYIKRDFRWYEILSRLVLDTLRQVSPAVEYYSIDEMFFDAGALEQACRLPLLDAIRAVQLRLLETVGGPVSLRVSLSTNLATLASDSNKPFGSTVLTDHSEIRAFLNARPVDEVSGIGTRSKAKLAAHGIHGCAAVTWVGIWPGWLY